MREPQVHAVQQETPNQNPEKSLGEEETETIRF